MRKINKIGIFFAHLVNILECCCFEGEQLPTRGMKTAAKRNSAIWTFSFNGRFYYVQWSLIVFPWGRVSCTCTALFGEPTLCVGAPSGGRPSSLSDLFLAVTSDSLSASSSFFISVWRYTEGCFIKLNLEEAFIVWLTSWYKANQCRPVIFMGMLLMHR